MASEPNIAIVGAGPVGGILGAYLANAGHYVVLCDVLKSHLDAIKERGLAITGVREMTVRCERVAYGIAELSGFPKVDTIIIATKSSILPIIVPTTILWLRSGVTSVWPPMRKIPSSLQVSAI